jgi:chemotaxis protein histidine kinase CheA
MDNNTLAIYIHELRNHCMHVQTSFDLFNQAMMNQANAGVLYGGQMILTSVSQFSALLWPTRARARSRGESLRKALQLPEKHPLNDRRLSELWERSDEKFEEWVSATKNAQVVFDFVGDPRTIHESVTERSIYRAYHPETNIFYYRGVAYNLRGIAQALSDVAGRINAVYRQLFPEHAKAEDEAIRKRQEEIAKAQAAAEENATAETASKDVEDDKKPAPKKAPAKKPAAKKAPAKKTASKTETKAAPKKAPAKKPAAKKPAAKKPAAKKAPAKK